MKTTQDVYLQTRFSFPTFPGPSQAPRAAEGQLTSGPRCKSDSKEVAHVHPDNFITQEGFILMQSFKQFFFLPVKYKDE